MSLYDFTVEEYAEFLEKELAGTDIVTLKLDMMGKRGRKPKQAADHATSLNQAEQSHIYKDTLPALKSGSAPQPDSEPYDGDDDLKLPALYDREGYIDFSPRESLPLKYDAEARLLGHFCNLVLRRLEDCESKVEEWKLSCSVMRSLGSLMVKYL